MQVVSLGGDRALHREMETGGSSWEGIEWCTPLHLQAALACIQRIESFQTSRLAVWVWLGRCGDRPRMLTSILALFSWQGDAEELTAQRHRLLREGMRWSLPLRCCLQVQCRYMAVRVGAQAVQAILAQRLHERQSSVGKAYNITHRQ